MFDTDLTKDYQAAASLGVDPEQLYWAGVRGALCDEGTRERLAEVGRAAAKAKSFPRVSAPD